jgi:hypothetical protein
MDEGKEIKQAHMMLNRLGALGQGVGSIRERLSDLLEQYTINKRPLPSRDLINWARRAYEDAGKE